MSDFLNASELQSILENAIINSKSPKAKSYIASGFFTPEQIQVVEMLESTFAGLGNPFYSPRMFTTDLSVKDIGIRSFRVKEILRKNIEELTACQRIIVNLRGKFDIGALWELGYAVYLCIKDPKKEIELICGDSVAEAMFLTIIENLKNSNYIKDKSRIELKESSVLITKDNCINFEASKVIMGYQFDAKNLNSVLQGSIDEVAQHKNIMFLIDNHPFQTYILMGFLYASGINYLTASFSGFGSNVMIAASSKGHIQLPGLQDNTKMTNKIE